MELFLRVAIVLLVNALLVAVIWGFASLVQRGRCRLIREYITAHRGEITKIAMEMGRHRVYWVVDYISERGDLRQAQISFAKRKLVLQCDQAYEEVLREEYDRQPGGKDARIDLRTLKLLACQSKLPGFAARNRLIKEAAAGRAPAVLVKETAADVPPAERFAAILQALRVMEIGQPAADPHVLDLLVDGKRTSIVWTVTGEPPDRLLVIALQNGSHTGLFHD